MNSSLNVFLSIYNVVVIILSLMYVQNCHRCNHFFGCIFLIWLRYINN